jgi:hypothetical protein
MNIDEAFEMAEENKDVRIDDPCDFTPNRGLLDIYGLNRTSDRGQLSFVHRNKSEPDIVTIFTPVPNREGEFTSVTRVYSRNRSSDDRLGAVEEV